LVRNLDRHYQWTALKEGNAHILDRKRPTGQIANRGAAGWRPSPGTIPQPHGLNRRQGTRWVDRSGHAYRNERIRNFVLLSLFFDAHGVCVVCGRAWSSPRHKEEPASLIRAQTSTHTDGEPIAGKPLVVHNYAVSCCHVER
jgi:hypothetical protein